MQITKLTGTRKNLTTGALVVAALLPLAALSCRNGPPRGDAPMETRQAPAPLVGEDRFVDGSIVVKASVAMGGMQRPAGGGGARRPPGGGGMPMGGPPGGGMPTGAPPAAMAGGGAPGGGMGGGAGPSHALVVTLTNSGSETVEFTIVDVKSRLGNFLPQPDTLALAPGQSGALYPMRGSLPDDVAVLELTVTIRTRDGRTDTRVITLQPSSAPAAGGGT